MAETPSAFEIDTEYTVAPTSCVSINLNCGAIWQRWEPHIHGPGTILNDQFKGSDTFERYIAALEEVTPTMKALGVTDYYSTEVYEAVVQEKKNGRLPDCELIFPNIEMRLDTGTVNGSWVNVHLLVCPDDANHISELKRFLSRLRFDAHGDSYRCTKEDLIKLGKKSDNKIIEDHKALEAGSVQFKISLKQLKEEIGLSDWAKANIIVAVAGGSDGTGGVRNAADTTLREEIEKIADIIFASSNSQREFWLGKRALTAVQIEERYGSLKPCMHGSDAHTHAKVGAPTENRYTWIKGAAKFDSLWQACIDPEGRAFIGERPPFGATPSQVIKQIEITNTNWCETPKIKLNPGLVAIIGARGSGKTALAEIIAAGCDAIPIEKSTVEISRSFLNRAQSELVSSDVSLEWEADRELVVRSLENQYDGSDKFPMARYLSQQFVDDLCSSDGVTDKLLNELERIIFSAHDINQREGTIDFASLLNLKASRPRSIRDSQEQALQELCDRIGSELDKIKVIEETKRQISIKEATINQYLADRSKLVVTGSEENVKRLGELTAAANVVRGYVRQFAIREQALLGIQDDVKNVRASKAPENLRAMQQRHLNAGLKAEEWRPFLTDFTGDVDTVVTGKLTETRAHSQSWKGTSPIVIDPNTALISEVADLNRQPLALLETEIERLTKLVSADSDTAQKYAAISQKVSQEQALLDGFKANLEDYEAARERVPILRTERDETYGKVFDALLHEEAILNDLYAPIMDRLASASGTLNKMSFSIKRCVDLDNWADAGESLFDLREIGPFKGKGTIRKLAQEMLLPAWENGNVTEVLSAMKVFREATDEHFIAMSKVSKSDKQSYRAWAMQFAKWLYSTDHIRLNYGVDYDGVDIKKLSPGTRGIVLLLLYLALDNDDDRPLIIDQPEENLDPKSIYDELVGLFILAKQKRQVIMVTHNANLVINTDADQIIIAQTGERLPSGMPKITYLSGGLEEAHIRKEVCGILEGGELAFQKRAHRLRVPLR
jgi:ABC-type cobalamin/Fe3+-siderophores transport system ATPase subunit